MMLTKKETTVEQKEIGIWELAWEEYIRAEGSSGLSITGNSKYARLSRRLARGRLTRAENRIRRLAPDLAKRLFDN
jgi:hypothetical protein